MVRPFSTEWLVSFKDPRVLWQEHWFALSLEVLNAAIVFLLLRNAKRKGCESFYVTIAAMISVCTFEILPLYPEEGYKLWWYHHGIINVLNQRVPSYIITSFAIVHYVAHNLTKKSNLPTYTRAFISAVAGLLMYLPYVWLAPRALLSLVHFDDPIFRTRLLDVPYMQMLVLFLLFFHTTQLSLENFEALEPQERNSNNYLWCSLVSGLVSGFYTIIEQYLLYLIFDLTLGLNIAVGFLVALAITFSIAKEEVKALKDKSFTIAGAFQPLKSKVFWGAAALMLFSSTLPLWLKVRDLKSSSAKLELGPCHAIHEVSNTSPLDIKRRQYICPEDGNHNFDFHCVDPVALQFGIKNRVNQYTVCGKEFDNPILTTTPITSENPSHHLHDKTSTRPGNSNNQRSASSSSDNSIQSCIAHDIPAPTQPKTNHSCSNPANYRASWFSATSLKLPLELLCTANPKHLLVRLLSRWWPVNPSGSTEEAHDPEIGALRCCVPGEMMQRIQSAIRLKVSNISLLDAIEQWRHVSSGDNPADLHQSWCKSVQNARGSHLWWEGPAFKNSEYPCRENL
ncbi:hypothetical protein HNY73_013020 [Argiope bruennichi]|uniref:DUF7802 domain-containing protein n=1 Tax=Argiope bruennichi TaxID=94029 RepID=A0A8T0EYV3_ARGBR|nr:hypothetical protein HNY73_013020 [Argiope bruennichi]